MTSTRIDEQEATHFRSPAATARPRLRRRNLTVAWVAVAAAAALVLAGGPLTASAAPATAKAAAAAKQTVVSLTFDDGHDTQMQAEKTLNQYKMKGTFYINTGFVGGTGFVTRANLQTLKADGHEIGGHTVDHSDLPTIASGEASREICNDRSVLTSWGYNVRSFAYPFASSTPAVEKLVKACGYNSARMLGDIKSRFGCTDCAYSETIKPANPYYIKALDQVDSTWTLDDLKNGVINAEKNGGGWVPYTFHELCAVGTANCADPATTMTNFNAFIKWLSTRSSSNNTVVKTVGDVIGGSTKPVVNVASTPPAGPGVNALQNPKLETVAATGVPQCWMQGGYGTNTASFASTTGRTGKGETVTVSGYVNGDAKLLQQFDGGTCSPTVVPGHTYSLRSYYKSTAVTQYAVYLRTAGGTWQYWTSSPWFPSTTAFAAANWTTPAIPAGMTGISFGLSLFNNGTLSTDDYAMYDTVGAPTVTTVAATNVVGPVAAPVVAGPVEVHMTGTDATTP